MKWVVIVVRTLVGVGLTITGLDGFLHFLGMKPPPETPEAAVAFGTILATSGYMYGVKACELLGGILLASGRMAPLGITFLMPVAVNILLFEVCLSKQLGPGVILVVLLLFLIVAYRGYFARVFTMNAKIGG